MVCKLSKVHNLHCKRKWRSKEDQMLEELAIKKEQNYFSWSNSMNDKDNKQHLSRLWASPTNTDLNDLDYDTPSQTGYLKHTPVWRPDRAETWNGRPVQCVRLDFQIGHIYTPSHCHLGMIHTALGKGRRKALEASYCYSHLQYRFSSCTASL